MRLVDNKELWYKYGVNYDEIVSTSQNTLVSLLEEFLANGMTRYLGVSIETLAEKSDIEIESALELAYAKSLWGKYNSGHQYKTLSRFKGISNNPEQGIITQSVGDFQIIWFVAPRLAIEGDPTKGIIFGEKLLLADSVIIKISDSIIGARSTNRGIKLIDKKLEELGVVKIETRSIEKEVDKSIEELLLKGSDHLHVTSVIFLESSLPDKSKLVISNDLGIHNDIGVIKQNGLISNFSITDIKSLDLKIVESGKKFNIKVKLEDEGYVLEMNDKLLSEEERHNIRMLLAKACIEISVQYKYQVEKDENTIFHKILSGATRAYEEYAHRLPKMIRNNLYAIARPMESSVFVCRHCKRENAENGTCIECGRKDLREDKTKWIEIDEEMILDIFMAQICDIGKTVEIDDVTYSALKFSKGKNEIQCEFTKTESTKRVAKADRYKFFIVPYGGKKQLSARFDEYLKFCSLITYGDAIYKERGINHFGTFDLYRLITETPDKKKQLFHEMIRNSLTHLEDRLIPLSAEAAVRLKKDDKSLTAKQFERDVSYLLKRLYPQTERFGRVGNRESDGLLIFTDASAVTTVASYDAKHSKDLYELGVSEQDKAVRYILDESMNHDISVATNGRGPTSHIIISNSLDRSKHKSFTDGIKKTLKLTKTGDEIKCSIIFLELRELLMLFDLYSEYATVIKGDSNVMKKYHDLTKELLTAQDDWKMITKDEVSDFKGKLLQVIERSPSLPHMI